MSEFEETKQDLLADLALDEGREFPVLEKLVAGESRYVKDARINLRNTLKSAHLNEKEAALIAYAVAVNNRHTELQGALESLAKNAGATGPELAEMAACASLLSVNNVFYRFRHFMGKESYNTMPAGIKMTLMARPITGKAFFELASLAVSAVNGCEACVISHEHSLIELGTTEAKIFDAVRLAAVVTGTVRILG